MSYQDVFKTKSAARFPWLWWTRCLVITVVALCLSSSVAWSQPAEPQPTGLSSASVEIGRILVSVTDSRVQAGVCVIDLAENQILFEHQPDEAMIPASAMKAFVMAAAVSELGGAFAFETVLATDDRNLFVIGGGDPGLGDAQLHRARGESISGIFESWTDTLQAMNLVHLTGDLVIDETIFDDRWIHDSWEAEDLGKWYAAPIGGLNYNDNCVDITIKPSHNLGEPVLVSVAPETSMVCIVNECQSGGEGKPILHHVFSSDEYIIRGRCNKEWPFGSAAFPDPGILFADSFLTVLRKRGVSVDGTIRRRRVRSADGNLPGHLKVMAVHRTSLEEVLHRIGKNSQNFFAECLLKRFGYEWQLRQIVDGSQDSVVDAQGSWASGAEALTVWAHRNLPSLRHGSNGAVDRSPYGGLSGFVVSDGSGLSRDNRCTARQLAEIMQVMHSRPESQLFLNSLSIAGVDGSLRNRFKDVTGRVYAKTGTMSSVCTLASYVFGDDSKPRFAFAIMFNGYRGSSSPFRRIQNQICRVLADLNQ